MGSGAPGCNLPEHHPVKDNDTRWSSGHDQMEWFRVAQRAVQLYDVNHARKAGEAYRQHQMNLEDWRINQESVAVLQPIADWTQHMQGTKYPTLPLVLPTVYGLIEGMAPETALTLAFPGTPSIELEPEDMHQGVLAARTAMHDDWVSRWITNLPDETKRTYAIATLLHPYFKDYSFIDGFDMIPSSDKEWALRELRTEWSTVEAQGGGAHDHRRRARKQCRARARSHARDRAGARGRRSTRAPQEGAQGNAGLAAGRQG